MGCASSKQALRDKPIAPLARSYSLPIHHPAQGKGDSHHVVALTSTTLGTLKLDHPLDQNPNPSSAITDANEQDEKKTPKKKNNINTTTTTTIEAEEDGHKDKERSILSSAEVLLQAKAWSNKMEGKISQIPKTPLLQTPPNEPETIDAWELMDGLEDSSPLRSFSFHALSETQIPETGTKPKDYTKAESPRPIWLQFNAADHPVIADFDPEILSHFRKALDELSPPNTCRPLSPEPDKPGSNYNSNSRFSRIGTVQERIRAFQERIDKRTVNSEMGLSSKCPPPPPRGEERVVIYFTSLRGVRKTYEDCCDVRLIFRGYGVRVDERDVSMHQAFRDELYEISGAETHSFGGLPMVFVKGRYVGGAEDVRQLHESGELGKLIRGCEKLEGCGGGGVACEGCGDVRFVPCDRCFGSCKIFDEDDGVFLRCPDCNENGIILCPVCCI
ncbi:hypothetical protein MRB53_015437 [Persea americana]|uniref:Uncharacterized protein n=1 Tax=Persea americana TaxID=3435 RepID=A0ACC2KE01_PERAE|nr:hypothetical protein MRB53_015437 [Persea americana]